MRKTAVLLLILLSALTSSAQDKKDSDNSIELYNREYDIILKCNLDGDGMIVPGHDLYGPLPGYLGKTKHNFYWLILSVEKEGDINYLQMVNDYGSEDLTATIYQASDSTFLFTQRKGSTIKLPEQRKWQKLPKSLLFKKRNKTK